MQHDLSTMTPATRAVFDALHYLGQGNVHELAEQSGKARSTTDKAIRALADADLIVPVDTDTDAAEGTPTRWTLAEGVAEAVTADNPTPDTGTEGGLGDADPADDTEHANDDADTRTADQTPAYDDPQPATQSDTSDTADQDDASHNGEDTNDVEDSHDTSEDGGDQDSNDDSDEDPDQVPDQDPDDDEDSQDPDENKDQGTGGAAQLTRPGDRKVMAIKAVLSEHGDDGATLDEIADESGINPATVSRLLSAMEQADAARLLDGKPLRWIAGPTKAAEVDPNPEPERCPVCTQIVKGLAESPDAVTLVRSLVRADATLQILGADETPHVVTLPKRLIRTPSVAAAGAVRRTDFTANADGNQPFAKGELEKFTLAVLTAKPGRVMTPQEIASAISGQLGGRTVSSGAVRNNCTKAAAAGRIVMVSDFPLTFVYPAPAGDNKTSTSGETGDSGEAEATPEQS